MGFRLPERIALHLGGPQGPREGESGTDLAAVTQVELSESPSLLLTQILQDSSPESLLSLKLSP